MSVKNQLMTIKPPDSYDLQNALFLAHAASACYESNPARYQGFKRLGFDEIVSFSGGENKSEIAGRGYVASTPEAIVLAFRGTDEVEDWLINLNVVQVKDHGALVHRGFFRAIDAVWPQIEPRLKDFLKASPRTIRITGHSLGGALATLAAIRIQRMGIRNVETYTFGQPRVGNRAMAEQLTTPLYRFAYYADPVRFAPFSVPRAMHYKHAGTLKLIDAAGRIVDKESHLLVRMLSNICSTGQLADEFRKNDFKSFLAKRINDHYMPNYIAHIENNLLRLEDFGPKTPRLEER